MCPSLVTFALVSQFHVYLPWVNACDCKTSCIVRKPSFEALVTVVVSRDTGYLIFHSALCTCHMHAADHIGPRHGTDTGPGQRSANESSKIFISNVR